MGIGLRYDHSTPFGVGDLDWLVYWRSPALVRWHTFSLAAGAQLASGLPFLEGDGPGPSFTADVLASWKVGWLTAGIEVASGFGGHLFPLLPQTSVVASYAPDSPPDIAADADDAARSDGWRTFVELAGFGGVALLLTQPRTPPLSSTTIPSTPLVAWTFSADLGTEAFRAGLRIDAPVIPSQVQSLTGYAHAVVGFGRLPAGLHSELEVGVGIANDPQPTFSALMEPSGVVALRLLRPFGPLRPAIGLEEIVQGPGPIFASVVTVGLGASAGASRD